VPIVPPQREPCDIKQLRHLQVNPRSIARMKNHTVEKDIAAFKTNFYPSLEIRAT
jgi:hypothetical protein